jgi:hypothetical protein
MAHEWSPSIIANPPCARVTCSTRFGFPVVSCAEAVQVDPSIVWDSKLPWGLFFFQVIRVSSSDMVLESFRIASEPPAFSRKRSIRILEFARIPQIDSPAHSESAICDYINEWYYAAFWFVSTRLRLRSRSNAPSNIYHCVTVDRRSWIDSSL